MNNTKNMKKLFQLNVMVIVAILACIALINYKIDPTQIFADYDTMARIFSEGNNIEVQSNVNERAVKKKFIEQLKKPVHTLVTGSSRSMIIYQELFDVTIFNTAMSGARIEEQMAMIDVYINKFGLPKRIILGIDPWVFNKNSQNPVLEFRELRNNYENFKNKIFYRAASKQKNDNLYISGYKKYAQLLELSYLKDSIKMFLNNKFEVSNKKFYQVVSMNNLSEITGNIYVKEDASLIYSLKTRLTNGEEWERFIGYRFNGFEEMDIETRSEFEKLVDYFYINNVEIEVYLSPYSPVLYSELVANHPQYYKMLNTVEDYIIEKSREGKFIVVGSYNPNLKVLKQSDFYDGIHVKKEKLPLYFGANSELSIIERLEQ